MATETTTLTTAMRSLRKRAAAAVSEMKRDEAEAHRLHAERQIKPLGDLLRRVLGVTDNDRPMLTIEGDRAVVEVDGLRFGVHESEHGHFSLVLLINCTRCGTPTATDDIMFLADLGKILMTGMQPHYSHQCEKAVEAPLPVVTDTEARLLATLRAFIHDESAS